ncbi:DUF1211 domain-containing protein [Dyella ginsengisoli]|uniref:DUF1211 domain-containing protein n=1 Tax=Dyella ginsengisoli TaxID=363848 RepID=A0ABW8JNG7_9GAMM
MSTHASQLERLTFFSDAVFAIAITLLVIEIHVPRLGVADDHAYLVALHELTPSFMGFILSFLVIGALWAAHHRVFGLLADYDSGLVMPNLLLLMVIAFMPFATALMSANPLARVPELFYAGTLFTAGVLQRWLFGKALRAPYLRRDVAQADVVAVRARSWALPTAALLAFALAWVAPAYNNFVLLMIPLLARMFPRLARRRLAAATA